MLWSGCVRDACWLIEDLWCLQNLCKHGCRPSLHFYTERGWGLGMAWENRYVLELWSHTFLTIRILGTPNTHTHAHSHTPYTHMHTLVCSPSYARTCTHSDMHTHSHTRSCTRAHKHTHRCAHVYPHLYFNKLPARATPLLSFAPHSNATE